MAKYINPIMPGYYPDPSVCRVGEYYYLVNSTFTYFPGVPIFRSKNLTEWEQIGNVLDRPSQLKMEENERHSGGIYAPTIRYHEGTYYMVTTLVSWGSFIVTAKDPAGPWSEPYFIEGAKGIDPSLFFDDDGRCYMTGTCDDRNGIRFYGDNEIWMQELDLNTMSLIGESFALWKGALRDCVWPEGPHMYKKDGYYYLMIAEGGTADDHAVTIARSENVAGPYVGYKKNPILTHRHLGSGYPVQNVGHADMFEAEDGSWYMVCLATRKNDGVSGLGRETFIARVEWQDGWPVVNPGEGCLLAQGELNPAGAAKPAEAVRYRYGEYGASVPVPESYSFDNEKLPAAFIGLRNFTDGMYRLDTEKKQLCLRFKAERITQRANPAFLGIRQRSHSYSIVTGMDYSEAVNAVRNKAACELSCGMVIVQSDEASLELLVYVNEAEKGIVLIKNEKGHKTELYRKPICTKDDVSYIELGFKQKNQELVPFVKGKDTDVLLPAVDVHYLSTEMAGGFVGNVIGMYASGNGTECDAYARFSFIKLENTEA